MIQAVAFCPHPPVLVPALAGTAAAETADLLAACDAAVNSLVVHPIRLIVLGRADRTGRLDSNAPAALGEFGGMPPDELDAVSFAGATALPLPLAIGRWLISRATPDAQTSVELWGIGPGSDVGPAVGPAPCALLAMGDGSARRGPKAPGYLDERAAPFDARVETALRGGDAAALGDLDAALGDDLLADGVTAWRAAGRLLSESSWTGDVTYAADPFGVRYFVAVWTPRR